MSPAVTSLRTYVGNRHSEVRRRWYSTAAGGESGERGAISAREHVMAAIWAEFSQPTMPHSNVDVRQCLRIGTGGDTRVSVV
jgi:hypothetical protein